VLASHDVGERQLQPGRRSITHWYTYLDNACCAKSVRLLRMTARGEVIILPYSHERRASGGLLRGSILIL
jgi:hypothetical protein